MALTYTIYINSGLVDATTYTQGSNLSLLEITNSDEQYYQTGFLELFDVVTIHDINDSVLVNINGIDQFRGYVSRREQTIEGGRNLTRYQLVGETYDLWRYHTDEYALYSGMTSYIASSLISSYCEDIGFHNYDKDVGYNIVQDIDLTNITVGDAINKLVELDGYSFYVFDGELHYYHINTSNDADFSVEESDIIEVDPIEQSDEDIVNDVLVVGGTGYSEITSMSPTAKSSQVLLKSTNDYGILMAQSFEAKDDRLSGIELYLDRTTDPHEPSDIDIEIWENTENVLFEDDFDNWGYLSSNSLNVKLADSYLMLSGATQEYISQHLYDSMAGYAKIGQTFVAPANTFANNATFRIYPTQAQQEFRYYILGIDGDGYPDDDNILCSTQMYSTTPSDVNVYKNLTLNFKTTPNLTNGTTYALVIARNGYQNFVGSPVPMNISYKGTNEYADGKLCVLSLEGDIPVGGPYWQGVSTADTYFDITFGAMPTSGEVYSKVYTEDCQYMRIDLASQVSSNKIYISGTNDGGVTWEGVRDGLWTDFGSESSDGIQLKYILSSNGDYTPKLGYCKLTVADDTSGFDNVLLSDSLSDYSNFSSTSFISSQISGGYLLMSGSADFYASSSHWVSSMTPISQTNDLGWNNYSYAYDKDWDTRAQSDDYTDSLWQSNTVDVYHFSSGKYIKGWTTKSMHITPGGYFYTYINNFLVSGGGTGGKWVDCLSALSNTRLNDAGESTPDILNIKLQNKYVGPISGVKVTINRYASGSPKPASHTIYGAKIMEFDNRMFAGGEAKTSIISSNVELHYLKAEIGGENLSYVTMSGSCNSGASWDKLINNEQTQMTESGYRVVLAIYMKPIPSGVFTFWPNTPRVNNITLTGYTIQAGGLPQSGSKVPHSSDISINYNEVPYPPSTTSWQTYTSPKLRLTEGNTYWLILEHISGDTAGEYWTHYYDPKSSYDGKIAWSWDAGYSWSTNATDPTQVPEGNMRVKLGWTEGDITATSSNLASIATYGRHFKKINDSSITSFDQANTRASLEVSGMTSIPKKGRLVIDGIEDMSNEYMFSANLTNFGIDEKFDIKSYTQRIDKNGFTTEITYGKHRFDIAQKVAQLERESNL